ncbi:MAG: Spy/CpxP family protein refolding chaperone [Phenylobacterium sp.]|uniref:Spy/CpxP family protein refolding chaperone n=1 Tax=Phenylobacterium sp. TaxID=1871053 RepID=UPI0027209525|nr:Spy/CpxP family protein refolding chaperone [Phenylobacterium sp.]MDO8911572.1 Spy/CpxP family protein refolding chaperone [Phenylobacterium sp.]MDP2012010.1 Spy/CpxP family protein refolding chaperone [Phenylobacterium sp.]MDP3099380.1 Spy/CpxP family protein refolding chaperone [Phenylobacterium sp.]MDP3635080.1 Spy/CpxP family protein refolding chaperone [Phenylobacterium sp.]MDP3870631.1 Spy/CpxP family protein refolding chaperone [Phenylobacterium sp.]
MIRFAALAAISLLAGPAAAQPPGPPPGMGDMHAMHGAGAPAAMKARMAEHMAQMDKDMHTILRLRPDQETAWRAFRDAMHHHAMPPMAMAAPKPAMTTPQRLDEMDKKAAERQALHAKMEAATRAFYAALAPDQQAVFDALHRMHGAGAMMHGAGPMMGRKMMMMHGGPGGPSHD